MFKGIISGTVLILLFSHFSSGQYRDWKYSGRFYILTTPEGADLPDSVSISDFPLLVRLNGDHFDFSQATKGGKDVRFTTSSGVPLSFSIEEWDPSRGIASIWIRIPYIRGNAVQEIKMYWGKPGAKSESSGKAVFNESKGYLSVFHMDDTVSDVIGTVTPEKIGTSYIEGIIGQAIHLGDGQGIACGEKISGYPVGADPSTTEAWVRANKVNMIVLGWGNEERKGKVIMQFASPPKIRMDCYRSDANVSGESKLSMNQWIHVVHTCKNGDSRIYVNGVLDGISTTVKNPLSVKSPVKMWIGGWMSEYLFSGDIDEVRISNVVRSAWWIKLQFENQKILNTLVGPIVKEGNNFSISHDKIEVHEGQSSMVRAIAEGARKTYWIIKRDGEAKIVAVDQLSYKLDAGRVAEETSFILQFKAVYENEVRIKEIPVKVTEDIPEPVFTLNAPGTWTGRDTIEVLPVISNLKQMAAKGAGDMNYRWTISGGAVIKKIAPEKLVLLRSQFSGKISISLALNNGGADFTSTTSIMVSEPENDPWILRSAGQDEKPHDNQFYARDDTDEGTLYYNGTLKKIADSVFLKIYADDLLYKKLICKPGSDRTYSFSVRLKAGLIKYRAEFGTRIGDLEEVLETADNIVCGDAYIIDGQSNAEANDYGRAVNPYTSNWIRSFGCMDTDPAKSRLKLWGNAVSYDSTGGKLQIGYWGIELARQLVENNKIPICLINGAVGGSRIDVHQRNESDKEDSSTIYGRLLWRVKQAGLTHGIRGVFWHQGENDQGAAGPTGKYGWETYQQYFIDMSASWKQDYPNIQHYYIFQIWPRSCAMTENGSDNMLREVQRTMPSLFSDMSIMSTLGIKPPGTCHFPPEGYAEFAHLIGPLVEHYNYHKTFNRPITPPDLKRAYYLSDKRDEIALDFDQPVIWSDSLRTQFYIDGEGGKVISGAASERTIILKIIPDGTYKSISYLDSKSWNQNNLLYGENGIAALTFCSVQVENYAERELSSATLSSSEYRGKAKSQEHKVIY